MIKSAFNLFFVSENVESVFENTHENKNREKVKKERNKKKLKTDKKSTEDADSFAEWEHSIKKDMSSFRNHFDDFKLKNQIFKRWQCHACNNFHLYKRCYYLFSSLTHEDWILRAEIKKTVKKALNEDEDFTEKIRKLQKMMKKKKKSQENWLLVRSIEKIESVFYI